MIEMAKLRHDNYEKITDDIMWFNSAWVLRFVVTLNKDTDKHGIVNYHKEVAYTKDGRNCVNINRSFDYYLLIECINKDEETRLKPSIMFRIDHVPMLKFRLKQICEWFTTKENENLFARKDGRIIILKKKDPIKIAGAMNINIEFQPSILNYENDDQVIGVVGYISNNNRVNLFINVNKLLAFQYCIDTFNMYLSAQEMINYIHRPKYGTNLYDITQENKRKQFL